MDPKDWPLWIHLDHFEMLGHPQPLSMTLMVKYKIIVSSLMYADTLFSQSKHNCVHDIQNMEKGLKKREAQKKTLGATEVIMWP